MLIQPFLDTNNNSRLDEDELLYLEDPALLLLINSEALSRYRPEIQSDGIALTLSPETYRLDIDSAGLPLDRTAREGAYAVEVVPGQYTTVSIPLTLAYTVSGVVMDAAGAAVPGARVEAIGLSGHRQLSITNGAGVYYLEQLQPETYDLRVNGAAGGTESLELTTEENSFLERNILLL